MSSIVYCSYLKTELGNLLITANEWDLLGVHFVDEEEYEENENYITIHAKKEITEYLNGTSKTFTFYNFELSGFQEQVLEIVLEIPYGETKTYRQIAKELGNEKCILPVANTLKENPCLIIIPCHRVIGSDGALHSYQADLSIKKHLLELEKKHTEE